MRSKQTIVSLLVTAALSLPCVVFAAGFPGTSDEAGALAGQRTNQLNAAGTKPDIAVVARPGSTDEARAAAAANDDQREPALLAEECAQRNVTRTPGTTDQSRYAEGRMLDAREACAGQHG